MKHFTMGVGGRGGPEAWRPLSTTKFTSSLKLLSEVMEHSRSRLVKLAGGTTFELRSVVESRSTEPDRESSL